MGFKSFVFMGLPLQRKDVILKGMMSIVCHTYGRCVVGGIWALLEGPRTLAVAGGSTLLATFI